MPRQRYSRPEPYKSTTKPAKWLGDWYIYVTQPDGKDKRVHRGPIVLGKCSEMTKGEAQSELDRRITEDRSPRDQKASGPETLEWCVRQWLALNKAQWEPETHVTMTNICEKRLPGLWEKSLSKVTREDIQEHLNRIASEFSQSTLKKVRNTLAAVFADALEDGKVSRNPMRKVKTPKTRKPAGTYLTEEECMRLLAASHGRDHLILRMAMVLGLRPGEIFGLREDDIEPGRLRIDEASRNTVIKRPKTEASKAYVALPPSLEGELLDWLAVKPPSKHGWLFPADRNGVPIRQENWRKRNMAEIAARAGIHDMTFQRLRRTTATHAQHVGSVKDVQGVLRHANPDVTAATYMQTVDASVRRVVEELDLKFNGTVQ